MADIENLKASLGDIPLVTDPTKVQLKSRDFYWYSPVLKRQLEGVCADLVVEPRDEAEVIRALRVCHRQRVPVKRIVSEIPLVVESAGQFPLAPAHITTWHRALEPHRNRVGIRKFHGLQRARRIGSNSPDPKISAEGAAAQIEAMQIRDEDSDLMSNGVGRLG